jgi:valyl-tRNA synthetase
VPWRNAAISGFILDPDRKKMSKSKGNVTTPMDLLLEHGSDAVRYWAASGRLGIDTALEPGQMKVGRRLAIKLLNASKFALGHDIRTDANPDAVTERLDQAMLGALADVVAQATSAMDGYEHQRALEVTEAFFWTFCDDYLELVKARAYGDVTSDDPAAASAHAALGIALSVLQRLFAPILPFATEEVWSWWQEGSVHRASWPTVEPLRAAAADTMPATLAVVGEVLSAVRKAKSEAKQSMRAEVETVTVSGSAGQLALLAAGRSDLCNAGRIQHLELTETEGAITVEVTLADPAR